MCVDRGGGGVNAGCEMCYYYCIDLFKMILSSAHMT